MSRSRVMGIYRNSHTRVHDFCLLISQCLMNGGYVVRKNLGVVGIGLFSNFFKIIKINLLSITCENIPRMFGANVFEGVKVFESHIVAHVWCLVVVDL